MDNTKFESNGSRRGSITIVALVITGMALVLAAGILRSTMGEMTINRRSLMLHEARNAAEAIQEYAAADVIRRFQDDPSLNGGDIRTTSFTIPASAASAFASTGVNLSSSNVSISSLSAGSFGYVPSDQTRNDPLGGKFVFTRSAEMLTKASLSHVGRGGSELFGYAYQEFELRDAPLFTHAIFYNMDLVIAPGPDMYVYGPVHTNGHLAVESGNKLRFYDRVTAAGNFYVGHKMTDWTFHSSGYDATEVALQDDTGTMVNVYKGGDRSNVANYYESRQTDWEEVASQRWGGMLRDQIHGVPILNPVSISDYVPDDPTTTVTNELENHAYALIEPLLGNSHVDRKSVNTRKEKFAMKAGLYLKVLEDSTDPTGYRVRAYKYNRSVGNSLLPDMDIFGNPTLVEIDLPPNLIGDANATMTDIEVDGRPEEYSYDSGADEVTGGLYDRRHRQQLDIVSLDIGTLKSLVDPGTSWDDTSTTSIPAYYPTVDWNGVVYVEFPTVSNSGGRTDKIVVADTKPSATGTGSSVVPGIALSLIDGEALPDPGFLSNNGLTVVTNAALYVVGNYNADNDATASDSATDTDEIANGDGVDEVPAAVVADSVTLLSKNWITQGRANSHENLLNSYPGNRSAEHTEWAFGLIAGYSPADPTTTSGDKNWGGGVQNLPRFLERWRTSSGGKAVATFRGSLVSLYESELQTEPYNLSGSNSFGKWFRAPERNWGYSDLFAANQMPPGIPSVRHPRLTNLEFIGKDEYDAKLAALP